MGMSIERAQSIIQAAHRNIVYFQEVNKHEKTEMTIDKSITLLTDYLEWQKLHGMDGTGIDAATKKLLEVAKKYQKITEILNSASYTENGTVYSYTYDEDSRVKHIREVVEDGNDRN